MHGLRHVPGSNHVNVSLLGMFNILSVISKYNLQSSNGTPTPITLSVCKDNHFFAYNTTLTYFSIYVPSFSLRMPSRNPVPFISLRIPSRNPVPFISCGFHPATLSRLFHADFIPQPCPVYFMRISSASISKYEFARTTSIPWCNHTPASLSFTTTSG